MLLSAKLFFFTQLNIQFTYLDVSVLRLFSSFLNLSMFDVCEYHFSDSFMLYSQKIMGGTLKDF